MDRTVLLLGETCENYGLAFGPFQSAYQHWLTCPTGFDTVFADARARILGDPTPQPSGPVLPFSAYPAAAQLEDTLRLREGLEQQIHVLDGEIAVLQAAVEKGGQ